MHFAVFCWRAHPSIDLEHELADCGRPLGGWTEVPRFGGEGSQEVDFWRRKDSMLKVYLIFDFTWL